MKYAVTGATGHFGQAAITNLLKHVAANEIVAIVRDEVKARKQLPSDIEIRTAAYDHPADLATAFSGIDRLLFVSSIPGREMPRLQQHLNVVNAAQQAGVKFIAYTSYPHANTATSPLSADHRATETAIIKTGIAHSFLRNNWYMENEIGLIQTGLMGKPIVYSAGDGKVGWALERDYAEAAALVLLSDQPKEVYEFTGQPHTFSQLGAVISEMAQKHADVRSISDQDYANYLRDEDGLDSKSIENIIAIQTLIRNGDLNEQSSDLTNILGRPLPTLAEMVKQVTTEDR